MYEDDSWRITDLTEGNGLLLNGIPVKVHWLHQDGQVIQVGRASVKFLSGDGVESLCFAEMYRRDITDFLTEVYNKSFFSQTLEKEVLRANRYRRNLSIMVIDLDEFGKVNKLYGQLAGDAVLKQAAACMKSGIRATDILGRVGGEEFAVLFPETDLLGAMDLAERLRTKLEETPCVLTNHTLRITLSAGVTTLEKKMNSQEFFAKANDFMRSAKNNGRNRVQSSK